MANDELDWEEVKILQQETVDINRKVKEKTLKINEDKGLNYPRLLILCFHVTTLGQFADKTAWHSQKLYCF